MKNLIVIIVLFCCGCSTSVKQSEVSDTFFKQYEFLLQKSVVFDLKNKEFKQALKTFIDTCTEYNTYLENRIKPFDSGRLPPVVLMPYFFNTKQDRCIVMVLSRTTDLKGAPVEYVLFVNSVYNKDWQFKLKEGYRQSFSYEGDVLILSDTEISLRVLRNMISLGYMRADEVSVNDDFFEKKWW